MLVADKKNKATYIVQMSWLRAAQNNAGNMRHIFGYRKAVMQQILILSFVGSNPTSQVIKRKHAMLDCQ